MRQDFTEDELLQQIGLPPEFQPGEKWNYSNPGYVTLGILIHKVSGKFYGDVLREKVFGPLGMATARMIDEADIIPNRAAGYRLVDGELKNQEWVAPKLNTTADGALLSDRARHGEVGRGALLGKLLKRNSLDLMWTPVKLNDGKTVEYGFGWMFGKTNGQRVIRHGGGWQGFSTHIARWVDMKLTVIVLTNLAGAPADAISNGVAALYHPELARVEHTAIQIDPKTFDPYLGEYEMRPGFVITVSREEDKLWMQATGQKRAELFAELETSFFLKEADIQLMFVKDASGKVTHLILRQGGFDSEVRKVK